MRTSKQMIRDWIAAADENARYMVVVCDTFSYDDYPVYTNDPHEVVDKNRGGENMQRVMEVYDLAGDTEAQLNEHRAWHMPPRPV